MSRKSRPDASSGNTASPLPFLLAGEDRSSSHNISIHSPFDNRLIAKVSQASNADAEEALAASERSFHSTRLLSSGQRSAICHAVAERLKAEQSDIARGIALEAAKPITDAQGEATRAIHTFTIAAEEALRITGSILPLDSAATGPASPTQRSAMLRRFPIGPILGITPFNFPINLVAHKIAPAVASGNPIIIKPAPQTPLTALRLGRTLVECGWPAGALSILPCSNDVAAALVADPRPRMLSFTGSAAVGWDLRAKAGRKRVTLELGGNAATLVHDDADLDQAALKIVSGGFSYAGQSCISTQRVFVQKMRWQTLAQKLVAAVETLITGDPLDEDTQVGPMISIAAAERAEAWINTAVSEGAHLLTGGKRRGAILEPTVLAKVPVTADLYREEAFAPVIMISPCETFEDGLALINSSRYGLQASVFTRDYARIMQAWRTLEVGAIIVNDSTSWRADEMPYGGVKDSGIGREGVRSAIREMTDERLLISDM